MEGYYNKSRIIMLILVVVVSLIMFINEDISMRLYGTLFIGIVTLVVSYLVTPISKKMIEIGDKIENKCLKILYYVFMLPVLLVLVYLVCLLVLFLEEQKATSSHQDMGEALGEAIIVIALYTVSFIVFIVPYVQSLIVVLLRNREKNDKK